MVDATLKPVGAELPHFAAIDSFRGLAILLILAGHVLCLGSIGTRSDGSGIFPMMSPVL